MLSYFTSWPVHPEWYLDTVPPGTFTFNFDNRAFHMWAEPLFTEEILRIGQPNVDTGEGFIFTCYTNADGLTQFDAAFRLEPFEDGSELIMRYVLDTETWIAGPTLGHGSQVAVLLADMLARHHKDKPRALAVGEVAIETFGADHVVVHVCLPDSVMRLIHVGDHVEAESGTVFARRFQVVRAHLDGPLGEAGGSLVVDDQGVRKYCPDVDTGQYMRPRLGEEVPQLLRDLAPRLWNGGEALGQNLDV
ncbi:hypothetical protein J2S70_001138 [Trueperella bonasi]|uniref:Uncharacterized protein n=1 Tax=Trueperella bonasi TaxID=312286 RepID=A0ABT9NGL8_9ACTO|nr:hypothetical protein [Trueperella bonasi]MDP9806556.1 hypothetical protein [Trueperella bonasi]